MTVSARKIHSRSFTSPLILVYAFAGLITVGTILLLLPFTQQNNSFTPFLTAVFTSTSAVTLTGLVLVDTATYWTRAGQIVIMSLMFIGGLGFMTIATFLLIVVGQRVTLAQRLLLKESLGLDKLGGLVRITIAIVIASIGIQAAGFVALFVRFSFLYTPAEAVWQAAFLSVSGFNNAGFIALNNPDGFSIFQSDPLIIAIMAILIVVGSISYWVLLDIMRFKRFALFSLNTKLVLTLTGLLIIAGAGTFLALEYQNPNTLGTLSLPSKVMNSLFHSISGRTAGFSTTDFGHTEHHTNFFFSGLMFIGGASASVAGGIKINTIAVILVAMLSIMRGRNQASAFGREIPQGQVQRAMVIGSIATAIVFTLTMFLVFSESNFAFIDLFFESVSAFGNVGLSSGITSSLSNWSHIILIAAMFIGKMAPITIGIAITQRSERPLYRYAKERVTIG